MGNVCECVCRQSDDDAEDALLATFEEEGMEGTPRGPPPPYQPQAPIYAMTEEQHLRLVQRITLIQTLPCGRYQMSRSGTKASGKPPPEKDSLPEKTLEMEKDAERKGEKRECPICMTDFVPGELIRLLPCMHFYHLRCIDDWLMRSFTCPTCMERVDLGMRTTIHSARRRRTYSSSSSSTANSSTHSSSEQLLTQSPEHPNSAHVVLHQSPRSPTPREQSPRSPTPREQSLRSPTPREQSLRSPTHREQSLRSPTHREQPLRSPTHREQPLRSPTHREQSLHSPTHREQSLHSPTYREQPLRSPIHYEQPPHSPTYREQPLRSPDSS